MNDRLFRLTLLIGVVGIWVLIFQNAGLISPVSSRPDGPDQPLTITGRVRVDGPVDVNVADIQQPLDVNLHSIVGRPLVESKQGMDVGVSSTKNTVIPIHWGEISIAR